MKNTKVIEQLLEIREKVKLLEEHDDREAIEELTRLIQESKELTNQYRFWDATKTKIEQAYDKLNEAEDLAMECSKNYGKNSYTRDLKAVFEAFSEGFKKMFA